MKILYAIQGTGNGHLSRARDVIPILQKKGDVDILISGTQADVDLPFQPKYRFAGLSFIFGKKGGVDLFATYKKSNLRRLLGEIQSLPIDDYDLVISDFEPVSSWACYIRGKACISFSHQSAVLNENAPRPVSQDLVGKALLKYYAPCTKAYGLHFRAFDDNIFTPVIRQDIRQIVPFNKGHYTVYLPAYGDKRLVKILNRCTDVNWEVFSKHNKTAFSEGKVKVYPINNDDFVKSMAGCEGIICGAGFETPAEALFLGKKLLVIPMKTQYEQQCNAAVLASMDVPVLKSFRKKHTKRIDDWIMQGDTITVDFPDITETIVDQIFTDHLAQENIFEPLEGKIKLKKFRELTFKRILNFLGVHQALA